MDYNTARERLYDIFNGKRATFADRIGIIEVIDDMHSENVRLHRNLKRHGVQIEVLADKVTDLCVENRKLRDLLEAIRVCEDDDADAHDCPLYDEGEPTRCAYGRIADELGLS